MYIPAIQSFLNRTLNTVVALWVVFFLSCNRRICLWETALFNLLFIGLH